MKIICYIAILLALIGTITLFATGNIPGGFWALSSGGWTICALINSSQKILKEDKR